MAGVNQFRENEGGKIGFIKKMAMLGGQLDGVPKEGVVADEEGRKEGKY